jgi:hypothetical protein
MPSLDSESWPKDFQADSDFAPLLTRKPQSATIRILVPLMVVDELDRLKRDKDSRKRWRAGYSLSLIDRLLAQPDEAAELRPAAPDQSRGSVQVELLLDPLDMPASRQRRRDRGPDTGDSVARRPGRAPGDLRHKPVHPRP